MSRGSRASELGAVSIEFLLAVIPVLFLFLAVVQFALVAAARLVVLHAALSGARSAAVVLHDDPARYGGEARGHVGSADEARSSGRPPAAAAGLESVLFASGPKGRLAVIRRAVSAPLAAFSPSASDLSRWFLGGPSTVHEAVGDASLSRIAFGVALYHQAALAIDVESDEAQGLVTIRVRYLFHCAVPLVSRILCRAPSLAPAAVSGVPSREFLRLLSATQERFLVLTGEATWPLQRFVGGAGA